MKENKKVCDETCTCGCKEGKECTCDNTCTCGCGDDCKCDETCTCGCHDKKCNCDQK